MDTSSASRGATGHDVMQGGGLANPRRANLCFLNAAVQLLIHSHHFRRHLEESETHAVYHRGESPDDFRAAAEHAAESLGMLADEPDVFGLLMRTIASVGENRTGSAEDLLSAIHRIHPSTFVVGERGDIVEVISSLLDLTIEADHDSVEARKLLRDRARKEGVSDPKELFRRYSMLARGQYSLEVSDSAHFVKEAFGVRFRGTRDPSTRWGYSASDMCPASLAGLFLADELEYSKRPWWNTLWDPSVSGGVALNRMERQLLASMYDDISAMDLSRVSSVFGAPFTEGSGAAVVKPAEPKFVPGYEYQEEHGAFSGRRWLCNRCSDFMSGADSSGTVVQRCPVCGERRVNGSEVVFPTASEGASHSRSSDLFELMSVPECFVVHLQVGSTETASARFIELLCSKLFRGDGAEHFSAPSIRPHLMFPSAKVTSSLLRYHLDGLICYGAGHYVSLFRYPPADVGEGGGWVLFDDDKVTVLGGIGDVCDWLLRSRFYPTTMLFQLKAQPVTRWVDLETGQLSMQLAKDTFTASFRTRFEREDSSYRVVSVEHPPWPPLAMDLAPGAAAASSGAETLTADEVFARELEARERASAEESAQAALAKDEAFARALAAGEQPSREQTPPSREHAPPPRERLPSSPPPAESAVASASASDAPSTAPPTAYDVRSVVQAPPLFARTSRPPLPVSSTRTDWLAIVGPKWADDGVFGLTSETQRVLGERRACWDATPLDFGTDDGSFSSHRHSRAIPRGVLPTNVRDLLDVAGRITAKYHKHKKPVTSTRLAPYGSSLPPVTGTSLTSASGGTRGYATPLSGGGAVRSSAPYSDAASGYGSMTTTGASRSSTRHTDPGGRADYIPPSHRPTGHPPTRSGTGGHFETTASSSFTDPRSFR
jgi:hypothetical protein